MTDLRVENHGSLALVAPETEAGSAWLRETAPEDALFYGGALVVEPRYVDGVVAAAVDAGLGVA